MSLQQQINHRYCLHHPSIISPNRQWVKLPNKLLGFCNIDRKLVYKLALQHVPIHNFGRSKCCIHIRPRNCSDLQHSRS